MFPLDPLFAAFFFFTSLSVSVIELCVNGVKITPEILLFVPLV